MAIRPFSHTMGALASVDALVELARWARTGLLAEAMGVRVVTKWRAGVHHAIDQ